MCITGPLKSDCDKNPNCVKHRNELSYYCPVHDEYEALTKDGWSACNSVCNGVTSQTQKIKKKAEYGGSEAVTVTHYRSCNTANCVCNLKQPWVDVSGCKETPFGRVKWQSRFLYDPNSSVPGFGCPSGTQSVQLLPC